MDDQKNKYKKHKKEKKATSKRKHDSDNDSSEVEWVEASSTNSPPKRKHEEWMEKDLFVPTYVRSNVGQKSKKKQEMEEAAARNKKILEERELNPYYKNKAAGIPASSSHTEQRSPATTARPVGDGGYSWLSKAYQRVKEQAEKESRTMEDVAAERWGSLENLEIMVQEAKRRMLERQAIDAANAAATQKQQEKEQYARSEYHEAYHKDKYQSSKQSKDDYTPHQYKRDKHDFGNSHTSYEKNVQKSPYEEKNSQSQSKSEDKAPRSYKFVAPSDDIDQKDSRFKSTSCQTMPSWKKNAPSKKFSKPQDSVSEQKKKNFAEENIKLRKAEHSGGNSVKSSKEELIEVVSSSEDEDHKEKQKAAVKMTEELVLNQNEMNYLGARLLRAKMEGDFDLASKIQKDFDVARGKRAEFLQSGGKVEESGPRDEVLENLVDFYPLPKRLKSKIKKKRDQQGRNVYVGPLRRKGFDKDSTTLSHMYEKERMSTIDDQMRMYFAAASMCQESLTDECDADVSGSIEKKMSTYQSQDRDMQKAIRDHKKIEGALKKCKYCWDKPAMLKHTVIAKGNNVFLCVPSFTSLVEGHCFIVPLAHVPSTLHLDEDDFKEIQNFKRALMKMSSDANQCMIFMETSYRLKSHPHAVVECIPMPKESGELAPLYFKKAIDESEHEWAQNKKLIDLSKKGFRHSVPKGLPFFSVEFGLQGGYAHIIEDEKQFPAYFGKEIVGGISQIDSHHIIVMKKESTQEICDKTLKLVKLWWNKYKNYV